MYGLLAAPKDQNKASLKISDKLTKDSQEHWTCNNRSKQSVVLEQRAILFLNITTITQLNHIKIRYSLPKLKTSTERYKHFIIREEVQK